MSNPTDITRSEQVLRTAILDVLCSQPQGAIGGRLRQALNESREPTEHPEDRCEECRRVFAPWVASTRDWRQATGRSYGGPILCQKCFAKRHRANARPKCPACGLSACAYIVMWDEHKCPKGHTWDGPLNGGPPVHREQEAG